MLTAVPGWSMSDAERIAATSRAIDELQGALAEAVSAARSNGATWDEVASALGVARQSAWRRFKEDRRMTHKHRRCSFCGLPRKEVNHLVAAPTGASICDQCLDLAHSMLTETRARNQ